jgi:transposase
MGNRINYKEEIKENVETLKGLIRKESNAINRDRLRFLLSLKEGSCKSQSSASKLIGLGLRQGQNNWRKYRNGGLKELLAIVRGSAPCKLSAGQLEELTERLKKDDIQFLHEGVKLIEEQYGQTYTKPGVHYLFKRLKIKKKTGRPVNIRQDKEGMESFKKNLDH